LGQAVEYELNFSCVALLYIGYSVELLPKQRLKRGMLVTRPTSA